MDFFAKVADNSEMGQFQSGQPRPENSGRKKGVPNRKTTHLHLCLEALGCDLPTKILELLPSLTPEKQVDTYLSLMAYIYPKRKALELAVQNDPELPRITINIPRNGREALDSK